MLRFPYTPIVLAFALAIAANTFGEPSEPRRADPNWWSLQPLRQIQPPDLSPDVGPHPVDAFVRSRLQERDLELSAPASPRTLIRRVTYNLTGLPPTPEEIHAFLDACEAETGARDVVGDTAYSDLLDRLLASPHYGEHWGRHWLDVVRFGESSGYEVNPLVHNLWPFRDYVIESFNDDKPFDRMVLEHLAGDAVDPGNPEVEIGMAFLVCGPHDIVGNQDPAQAAQIRANSVDDMVRATSEAFLGLTVGCARCHDHKFDPIAQKDYYRMYAAFAGVYPDNRTVASDAEREAYEQRTAPLREKVEALREQRETLRHAIIDRAKEKAAEYESRWPRPPVSRQGAEEIFEPVTARYVRLVSEGRDTDPYASSGHRLDEFEAWTAETPSRNVALASNGGSAAGESRSAEDFGDAYLPEQAIDGKYGARWISQGSTLTITFSEPQTINRVVFSSDRTGALSETSGEAPMVCEYHVEVSEDGERWTEVANSYDRQPMNDAHRRKRYLEIEATEDEKARRAELQREQEEAERALREVPGLPVMRVGRLDTPDEPQHLFIGGDPMRKGEEVGVGSLSTLAYEDLDYELDATAPERERRYALAQWIVSDENPLTPRVLANRIWQYHFGAGLVSTPSDFGFMGAKPSHPELLDWLAHEIVFPSDGEGAAWRLKRIHKLIMTSDTYRQSGAYRETAAAVDADSRLLWRFPPRRLTAEEIRDSMLAVAGKLDTTMGGPGFRLYRYIQDNVATYLPLDEHGEDTYRRAVYHQNARSMRVDLMTEFDHPDCAFPIPKRAKTTSPLQALTMMNHNFTLDMAEFLAQRLENQAKKTADQVETAFELAFARKPTQKEVSAAQNLVENHDLEAFCRALFNTNEFIYLN